MSNYVYDNTDLFFPKSDLEPLPGGADPDEWVVAEDWNTLNQAVDDIKGVLRGAVWYGLNDQSVDPAPSGISAYIWLSTAGVLNLKNGVTTTSLVQSSRTITAGTGLSGGGALSANLTLNLADTAVTPDTYTYATITVDQQGRITAASSGAAGVTDSRLIIAGVGLDGGGDLTADVTIDLADTSVTPGAYALASFVVDQQGRITSASDGGIGTSLSGVTTGSVLFVGAGGVLAEDNSEFFWDNTNNRLGLGTASPQNKLHVIHNVTGEVAVRIQNTHSAGYSSINFYDYLGAPSLGFGINNGSASPVCYLNTGLDFLFSAGAFLGNLLHIDVDGGIELYSSPSSSASASSRGKLIYNSSQASFQTSVNTGSYYNVPQLEAAITTGSILFANSSGRVAQDNSNLYWDDTNNRFTVGAAGITKTGFTHEFAKDATITVAASAYGTGLNSEFMTFRGRGTAASTTVVQSGDVLGAFSFTGAKSATAIYTGAFIRALTTELWSATAGGTKLQFYTTPNTTQTQTIRAWIGQDGTFNIDGGGLISNPSSSGSGFWNTALFSGVTGQDYSASWSDIRIQSASNSGGQRAQYLTFNGRWSGNIDSPTLTQGFYDRVSGIEFNHASNGVGPNPTAALSLFVNAGSGGVGSETTVTPTRALTISYLGRVGIGILNPAQALHVTGTARATTGLIVDTMTTGSIWFAGASGALTQDNSNLFWDDTNNRLGIGTSGAPSTTFHVVGVSTLNGNTTLGSTVANRHICWGGMDFTEAVGPLFTDVDTATGSNMIIYDSTASAAGVGGGILFSGNYTGTSGAGAAAIKAMKSNGTPGDVGFDLAFGGRATGGNITESFRLLSTGSARLHSTIATTLSIIGDSNNSGSDAGYTGVMIGRASPTSPTELWFMGRDGTAPSDEWILRASGTTNILKAYAAGGLEMYNSSAAVSASNAGKIKYTTTGQKLQASHNGAAYFDVGTYAAALTTGSVLFANSSNQIAQDNTNFFWDDTNNWLGIGTAAPAAALDVRVNLTGAGTMRTYNTHASGYAALDLLNNSGTYKSSFAHDNANNRTYIHSPTIGFYITGVDLSALQSLSHSFGTVFDTLYYQMLNGGSAAVSSANAGRLIYNSSGQKFQVSLNTAAYVDLLTASTGALQTTTLTAGAGLTGGGDLSTNRTFTVGAGTGITVNADDVAVNQTYAFAWTADHTWKSHAAFTGSVLTQTTKAQQTTDDTQTHITLFTLADTFVYWVEVEVIARDEAAAERAMYGKIALVYREGGSATIQGSVQDVHADVETSGGLDATITVSGNDVRLSVTGLSATSINWVAKVQYQAVSDNA